MSFLNKIGVYIIKPDECIFPRRGLIIERDDRRVHGIHFIIGVIGWKRHIVMVDYGSALYRSRLMYWFRIGFDLYDRSYVRPMLGASAIDGIPYDKRNNRIRVYL